MTNEAFAKGAASAAPSAIAPKVSRCWRPLPLLHVSSRQCGAGSRLGDVPAGAGDVYCRTNRRRMRRPAEGAPRILCRCGTQVCFTATFLPGLIDMTIGSFDSPETLPPTLHYWESKRLPWLQLADDLPRFPEFPPPP